MEKIDTTGAYPMNSSTPVTPGSAFPKSSALQNRITSVLSASYADLEIRDALAILDERGLKNTADTRRNLRLDAQQELIECNGEIVHDFGKVADQLKRIGAAIASLNNSCAEIRKHVTSANRETGPMLDEARTILTDKRQVDTKQRLLDAFKAHFVLSETDVATLTSPTEPVNDDFFRILTRVKKIHSDSQVLLGSDNQRLGLDILEQSSKQLDTAYQKLYRWIQREFKNMDLENLQISVSTRRALRVLAERPSLFQNCLDYFAEARENIMSNNFYAALTGIPVDAAHPVLGKAIELSAHDPLRYIGDMLAWAHSATVSEREALEALFISNGDEIARSIQAGIESDPLARAREGESGLAFDGRRTLQQLVDRDLTGVFRLLKQRTEQVIQGHEDASLVYEVSNLVTFYVTIFSPLLGDDSNLLGTLRSISESALQTFKTVMRDRVLNLRADFNVSPDSLSTPEFLADALDMLRTFIKSYSTSNIGNNTKDRIEGFRPIVQEALDPFLAACENIAKGLRSPDSHIFGLNYLLATQEILRQCPFTDRHQDLQHQIDRGEDELIAVMHQWLLRESGLNALVGSSASRDDLASFYQDSARLVSLAQRLDAFLPNATEDARSYLAKLEDRVLTRQIIEMATERFCKDFERIQDLIIEADAAKEEQTNGETSEEHVLLRDIFPRTADEIRVLLS